MKRTEIMVAIRGEVVQMERRAVTLDYVGHEEPTPKRIESGRMDATVENRMHMQASINAVRQLLDKMEGTL